MFLSTYILHTSICYFRPVRYFLLLVFSFSYLRFQKINFHLHIKYSTMPAGFKLIVLQAVLLPIFPLPLFSQLERFSRHQLTRDHNSLFSQPSIIAAPAVNKYKHIPLNNSRVLQITHLLDDNPEMREEKYNQLLEKILLKRKPVIEDLKTVQQLELQLLDLGIYAICRWEKKLPPPLDTDEQCSEKELKYILNNKSVFTYSTKKKL